MSLYSDEWREQAYTLEPDDGPISICDIGVDLESLTAHAMHPRLYKSQAQVGSFSGSPAISAREMIGQVYLT